MHGGYLVLTGLSVHISELILRDQTPLSKLAKKQYLTTSDYIIYIGHHRSPGVPTLSGVDWLCERCRLCCCVHLLSIRQWCSNRLLTEHMLSSSDGHQRLLLQAKHGWRTLQKYICHDMANICNIHHCLHVSWAEPLLVKGRDGANVYNVNLRIFHQLFVASSSFGNAMLSCKPGRQTLCIATQHQPPKFEDVEEIFLGKMYKYIRNLQTAYWCRPTAKAHRAPKLALYK